MPSPNVGPGLRNLRSRPPVGAARVRGVRNALEGVDAVDELALHFAHDKACFFLQCIGRGFIGRLHVWELRKAMKDVAEAQKVRSAADLAQAIDDDPQGHPWHEAAKKHEATLRAPRG